MTGCLARAAFREIVRESGDEGCQKIGGKKLGLAAERRQSGPEARDHPIDRGRWEWTSRGKSLDGRHQATHQRPLQSNGRLEIRLILQHLMPARPDPRLE